MKKQLSVVFCSVALFFGIFSFSTNALAVTDEKSYKDGEMISSSDTLYETEQTNVVINETDNVISPYGIFISRDKTVVLYSSNLSSIPDTHYYKEYYQGYWYEGNLKFKSTAKYGAGYKVTFSGKITAWIP